MSLKPSLVVGLAGILIVASNLSAADLRLPQFGEEPELAAGKLLVASDKLQDPNFSETVILLVQYGSEDGALGLVLNHRSEVLLTQIFNAKDTRKDPIYLGGPVQIRALQALLRSPEKTDGTTHVTADIYATASKHVIEKSIKSHVDPSRFRLYLGYAGWQPGQLEAEVRIGAWSVFTTASRSSFDQDPDSLWERLHAAASRQIASARRPLQLLPVDDRYFKSKGSSADGPYSPGTGTLSSRR
jgi:putative transcriptional regulator